MNASRTKTAGIDARTWPVEQAVPALVLARTGREARSYRGTESGSEGAE